MSRLRSREQGPPPSGRDLDDPCPGVVFSPALMATSGPSRGQWGRETMLILGIDGDTTTHNQDDKSNLPEHDSAAILMRDGELLAAVEEERLDRIKHSGFFPSLAIRHCLSAGGVSFADIDRIVFHSTESAYYSQELKRFIYDP